VVLAVFDMSRDELGWLLTIGFALILAAAAGAGA
jgi:hypothetical protein